MRSVTAAARAPLPPEGGFLDQIGPTPLVSVRLEAGQPAVWFKLEFLNPSGSIKDRIDRYMLAKAWRQGILKRGAEVIEASSGSTSIALALACAQMDLRFTAVMPEGVSQERVLTILAYGGSVLFVPREAGIRGAIERAEEESVRRGAYSTRQFENPDNAEAHRVWTGQEILAQMKGGSVHGVVSGLGTGGTLLGLYQAFKDAGCPVTPFAARPKDGGRLEDLEHCSFSRRVPGVVDCASKLFRGAHLEGVVEIVNVSDDDAVETARALIRRGFPVGPSSGLNYAGAVRAAQKLGEGANVVTVFPDRMERYYSTELILGA